MKCRDNANRNQRGNRCSLPCLTSYAILVKESAFLNETLLVVDAAFTRRPMKSVQVPRDTVGLVKKKNVATVKMKRRSHDPIVE